MSAFDRFERELPSALTDVAGGGRSDYLTDILGRTARTRQRPAWASLERWLPMDLVIARTPVARIPWRTVAVVAGLLILLVAVLALYAGSQRRLPLPFGPAANGVIPYDANGDILVADPATGGNRVVLGGPANDYGPTFSPDGTKIGFVREASGGEDVYVMGSDGENVRKITPEPLQTLIGATWMPDSQALVVAHDVDGRQVLQVLDASGSAPSRTIAAGLDVDWVVFRPPLGDEMLVRGTFDGQFGLYRMNPDGSDIQLLVPATIAGDERFGDNQDLNFPAYSPDGTRIYFNRYVSAAETIQAWVMNADGSNPHRFNASGPACCWWEGEMAPSPDGTSVLMWRVAPDAGGSIALFPADGSGHGQVIGPDVVGTAHWAWSPDSSRVLLNYNDSAEGTQVVIDPVTGDWTKGVWNDNAEPDWQRLAL